MLILDVSRAETFSISMSGLGYIMWEVSQGHPQRNLRQKRESEELPGGTRRDIELALGSKEGNVISEQQHRLRATQRRDQRAWHSEVTRTHGLEREDGVWERVGGLWLELGTVYPGWSTLQRKGHFPFPKGMLNIVEYAIQLLKGPS